jgi:hypothetical protein
MKYDDASWHVGGEFPKELPPEAGATHIGMFAAWCMLTGLAGELHEVELDDELQRLRQRKVTPGAWFIAACDGKLVDEDLSDEGILPTVGISMISLRHCSRSGTGNGDNRLVSAFVEPPSSACFSEGLH